MGADECNCSDSVSSEGGVQRGSPLWQPVCHQAGGSAAPPQFPKGGRVGIKDICLIGTMRVEKNLTKSEHLLPTQLLDIPKNVCAILPSERELQPSPNRPIRYRPMGHGAEPAGTRSRIDTPALDARQGCGADCDAASGRPAPESRTHTLTTELSGAAQHRAAGCPWHSRCHYPRSHSASRTVAA